MLSEEAEEEEDVVVLLEKCLKLLIERKESTMTIQSLTTMSNSRATYITLNFISQNSTCNNSLALDRNKYVYELKNKK